MFVKLYFCPKTNINTTKNDNVIDKLVEDLKNAETTVFVDMEK